MSDINGSALGPASRLQYYSVTIDDYEIPEDDVMSCEIIWDSDKFGIEGTLTYIDNMDTINLSMLDTNNTVTIYAKDVSDTDWKRSFIIVDIIENKIKNQYKTYTMKFIDEIYFLSLIHI